jgi:hypothetical protein
LGLELQSRLMVKHQVGVEYVRYHRERFGVLVKQ